MVYVIILDREGRVAAHSQQSDCRGSALQIRSAQKALRPTSPSSRPERFTHWPRGVSGGRIPVFPTDERDKWGTVRVGISLQGMYGEIQRTRLTIFIFGYRRLGWAVAALILARRITSPLEIAGRSLGRGGGEIWPIASMCARRMRSAKLATTFNRMTNDLQAQQAALQEANRELDAQLREVSNLERYTMPVSCLDDQWRGHPEHGGTYRQME